MASSHSHAVFILAGMSLALVGCQGLTPPPEIPVVTTTGPVYVDPSAPVVMGPPTMIDPNQPGALPAFPDPLSPPPQPAFAAPTLGESTGAIAPDFGLPAAEASTPALPNPLKLSVSNHDFAWDQIVDVVSDYFPIALEERVHIDQQMWTEGRVETPYQVAATMFEPLRKDSVGSFNRWQSTLQTIRRRAVVRVVPEPDGYLVDIQVDRELEDLPKPEEATAGTATLFSHTSLPSPDRRDLVSRTQWSPVWIALGRDTPLEQKMLAEMQARLALTPHVPMTITPTQ